MLDEVPWVADWKIEYPILLYPFLGALVCAIFTSIFPFVSILKRNLLKPIREGSRTLPGSTSKRRRHSLFVIGQIAMSVLLMLAAFIATLNLKAVLARDIGFETKNHVALEMQYPINTDWGKVSRSTDSILEHIKNIPGVINASTSSKIPIDYKNTNFSGFSIPTFETGNTSEHPAAIKIYIRPEYFETIGSAILEGRDFTELDQVNAERVVIISDNIRIFLKKMKN